MNNYRNKFLMASPIFLVILLMGIISTNTFAQTKQKKVLITYENKHPAIRYFYKDTVKALAKNGYKDSNVDLLTYDKINDSIISKYDAILIAQFRSNKLAESIITFVNKHKKNPKILVSLFPNKNMMKDASNVPVDIDAITSPSQQSAALKAFNSQIVPKLLSILK